MEYPSPDDPDRFEERLRTRFLWIAGAIFFALAFGLLWLADLAQVGGWLPLTLLGGVGAGLVLALYVFRKDKT